MDESLHKFRKWINFRIDRSQYCGYDGNCFVDDVIITNSELCMYCKWRVPMDIQKMLESKKNGL